MADDLWSYSAKRPAPAPVSVESSDSDEEALPANSAKRRQVLRQRANLRQQTRLANASKQQEPSASESDDEPATVEPPRSTGGPAEFELPAPLPKPQPVVLDEATQRLLEENRRAMAQLEEASRQQPIELSDSEEEPDASQPHSAPESPTTDAAPVAAEQRVRLVCQSPHGTLELRLRKGDPFVKLFSAYRQHAINKGWLTAETQLHFEFDGDSLREDDTPENLDCDDGDKIDVVF